MRSCAVALGLVLFVAHAFVARADVYEWTDEDTSLHATDDPGLIPAGQRVQVRQTETENEEQEVSRPESHAAGKPPASAAAESADKRGEAHWRDRFTKIRDQLALVELCRQELPRYCENEYYATHDPNAALAFRKYLNQKNAGEDPDESLLPKLYLPESCEHIFEAAVELERPQDEFPSTCLWRVTRVTEATDAAERFWQGRLEALDEEASHAAVPRSWRE